MITIDHMLQDFDEHVVSAKPVGTSVDIKLDLPPAEAGLLASLYRGKAVTHFSFDGKFHYPVKRIVLGAKLTTVRLSTDTEVEAKRLAEAVNSGIIEKMKPSRVQ